MKTHTIYTLNILIISLLSSICVCGQNVGGIFPPNQDEYIVLDSVNLRLTYEYAYVQDVSRPNSFTKDELYLLVGNNISKFCNTTFLKKDYDGLKVWGDAKQMASGTGLNATEIYKDLTKKKEIVAIHLGATRNIHVYEEELYQQTWKITSDTATILSYPCMKATTEFRGRAYTAWFTLAIPINNGPWKFGGLPGMILKVTDSNNYFSFTCIGIKQLKIKEPIVKFDGDYISASRSEIAKLIKLMHQSLARYMTALGNNFIKPSNNKEITTPYNPLELE